MTEEIIWSGFASALLAGGLWFAFRLRAPSIPLLFLVGLAGTGAKVSMLSGVAATSFNPLITLLLNTLQGGLPVVLYIVAGREFRRLWRPGLPALALFWTTVFSGSLVFQHRGDDIATAFFLVATFKLAICLCLILVVASLWRERFDDMVALRLASRTPLAGLVSITVIVTLIYHPASGVASGWLILTVLSMAGASAMAEMRKPLALLQQDQDKLEALRALFVRRRIYRESDLTLERLGDRLLLEDTGTRRLVHAGMGFRWLGDLLDHHRIKAARIILEDVDQAETSLEEVAISVGYGSRAPFDLAFKRAAAETAAAYRNRHLAVANANRPLQLTNSDR